MKQSRCLAVRVGNRQCSNPATVKGLCLTHYFQFIKYGEIEMVKEKE